MQLHESIILREYNFFILFYFLFFYTSNVIFLSLSLSRLMHENFDTSRET